MKTGERKCSIAKQYLDGNRLGRTTLIVLSPRRLRYVSCASTAWAAASGFVPSDC